MTLDTTNDLFYLALSIATIGIAGFLCWALAEVARLLHQTNDAVKEVRDRAARVENAIVSLKERFDSSLNVFGMLAEGGKTLLSYFVKEKEEGRSSKKKRRRDDEDEDDE